MSYCSRSPLPSALMFVLALLALCAPLFSQTPATISSAPATGVPPFSTVSGGPDNINLANLNFQSVVPIISKPGRGTAFDYGLLYDSSIYQTVTQGGYTFWVPVANWGWKPQTPGGVGFIHYKPTEIQVYDRTGRLYDYFIYDFDYYMDGQGVKHGIYAVLTPMLQDPSLAVLNAAVVPNDDSGYSISLNLDPQANVLTGSITSPSGSLFHPPISQDGAGKSDFTDSNGNQISNDGSTYTDTLGMIALHISGIAPEIIYNPINPTVPPPYSAYYSYFDHTGNQQAVVANYKAYTILTAFSAPNIIDYYNPAVYLITSIGYPDGTQYSFSYEPTPGGADAGCSFCVTGRMASVTLPTGGTISYAYTGGYNGILPDGSTAGMRRTTSDGTTTYSRIRNGDTIWETTVKDPAGNETIYDFSDIYETQRRIYQGTVAGSKLLKRSVHCYNGNTGSCEMATVTPPIQVKFDYSIADNVWFTQGTYYNSAGLPTSVEDYSDGIGGHGGLQRRTAIDYAALGNNIVDRPSQISVYDGTGTAIARASLEYDGTPLTSEPSEPPQHIAVSGSRGNLTKKTEWLNTNPAASPITTYSYDTLGNLLSVVDPGGHTSSYIYGYNYGFVKEAIMPTPNSGVAHKTSATYMGYSGRVATLTDENSQTTSYTYDAMLRPTTIAYPDGGQTTVTYGSGYTLTQQRIDATGRQMSQWVQVDGYGRVIRTATANGEDMPYDQQDFCYSPQGAQSFSTYPYQGPGWATTGSTCYVNGSTITSTQPGDTTTYDAMGRPVKITHSDKSFATSIYAGRAVQITDEGNGSSTVQRIHQRDGLGRVTSTCEISSSVLLGNGRVPGSCGQDIAATGFLTTYDHDLLGNLTAVHQSGLADRAYQYDSLSRLISETSPEAFGNPTSYTYNSDGLLTGRTRPASNQASATVTVATNYIYDELHRLSGRSYSDGSTPASAYAFDKATWGRSGGNVIGRLDEESTFLNGTFLSATAYWNYDAMGRPQGQSECTPRTCGASRYDHIYTYDLLGNTTSQSNGVGVTVSYAYNGAPRITGVTSSFADATHPETLLSGVKYGTMGPTTSILGDGIAEARGYDPRLGLQSYSAGGAYSYSLSKAPNGRVTTGNDSATGAWLYSFDQFNRLVSSSKPGESFTYEYDRFGNRWNQRMTAGSSAPGPSYTFDKYNHITNSGFVYDALGNIINDGGHAYSYDAESRMIAVDDGNTATYTYDAEGRRVKVATAGGASVEFLYDLDGNMTTELNGNSGTWAVGEVFAGSRHIATYSNSQTYFSHQDWLGTERVHTLPNGNVAETCTGLAFGDAASPCWDTQMRFTGYFHDAEDNLEHSLFRQYSSAQGRFMTPDPYSGSMDPMEPQSFNRYSYVMNDPTGGTDPDGLFGLPATGGGAAICGAPCAAAGLFIDIFRALGLFGGHLPDVHMPQATTAQTRPLAGETNGIPDGVRLRSLNVLELIGLAPDGACDFGPCGGGAFGFSGGDPLSSHPLACDAGFIKSASEAWQRAGIGTQQVEAGFFVIPGPNGYTFQKFPYTNEVMTVTGLHVPRGTSAMTHTHPTSGAAPPSTGDITTSDKISIPFYVLSNRGLFVHDPGMKGSLLLRSGLSWLKMCK